MASITETEAAGGEVIDVNPEADPYINYVNVVTRVNQLLARNPEGVETSATGPFLPPKPGQSLQDRELEYGDEVMISEGKKYWIKQQKLLMNGVLVASRIDYRLAEPLSTDGEPYRVSSLSLHGVHGDRTYTIGVDTYREGREIIHIATVDQAGLKSVSSSGPFTGEPGLRLAIADKFGLQVKPEVRQQTHTRRARA